MADHVVKDKNQHPSWDSIESQYDVDKPTELSLNHKKVGSCLPHQVAQNNYRIPGKDDLGQDLPNYYQKACQ